MNCYIFFKAARNVGREEVLPLHLTVHTVQVQTCMPKVVGLRPEQVRWRGCQFFTETGRYLVLFTRPRNMAGIAGHPYISELQLK